MTDRFTIGDWSLDVEANTLTGEGRVVRVEPKVVSVCACLARRAGEVIRKEDLIREVWPDTFVTDDVLTGAISDLRKTFGDDAKHPRFIETIPKRGYRLIAPVARQPSGTLNAERHLAGGAAAVIPTRAWTRRSWRMMAVAAALAVPVLGVAWRSLITARPSPLVVDRPLTSVPAVTYGEGFHVLPAFSPDGTRLSYSSNTRDGAFLEVQMLGSENRLRLTRVRARSEISSAWSPDGRQLVFARAHPLDERGLFLVSSMGGPERKLRSLAPWPIPQRLVDWSPDGRWIVFADESAAGSDERDGRRGPHALFLLSVDSLETRQITTPGADEMGDSAPVFSPDGSSIAFVHTNAASFDEIRVISAQGGTPSTVVAGHGWSDGLTWAADGRSLIFDRTDTRNPFRLWRVPSHGGPMVPVPIASEAELMSPVAWRDQLAYEVRQFTLAVARVSLNSGDNPPPETVVSSTRSDHGAHYSPLGDRIAFLSARTGSDELWIADAGGENAVQLTHLGLSPLDTAWSPDGQTVAITTSPGSVYIVSIETGRARMVPLDEPYLNSTAAFSRDGRFLYVATQPASRQALLKVPLDGSPTIKILEGVVTKVAETPDGRTLLYSRPDPFGGKPPGIWKRAVNETDETFVMPASENWDVGGDGLYVMRTSGQATEPDPHDKGPAIERYNLAGAYLRTVARLGRYDAEFPLSVAPDGRSALFSHPMTNTIEIDMVRGYK